MYNGFRNEKVKIVMFEPHVPTNQSTILGSNRLTNTMNILVSLPSLPCFRTFFLHPYIVTIFREHFLLHVYTYVSIVTPERSSDVVITTLPPSTLTQHTIRVTCLVHGIQDLTLSVKNEPTANNPIPASETTTIK